MKWKQERIDRVRARIASIRDLRAKQERCLQELEYQLALMEQGIDPQDVAGIARGFRDMRGARPERNREYVVHIKLKNGETVDLNPPIFFPETTDRKE